MRRIVLVVLISMTSVMNVFAQEKKWISEGWLLFNEVNFKEKYFKSEDETFLVPVFTPLFRAKAGSEVSVSGYYMPLKLQGNRIILSKYPYSACFFCGGAGPQSVVEVVLVDAKPKLRADQIISVKGKLSLNDTDVNHLSFILLDALILE